MIFPISRYLKIFKVFLQQQLWIKYTWKYQLSHTSFISRVLFFPVSNHVWCVELFITYYLVFAIFNVAQFHRSSELLIRHFRELVSKHVNKNKIRCNRLDCDIKEFCLRYRLKARLKSKTLCDVEWMNEL